MLTMSAASSSTAKYWLNAWVRDEANGAKPKPKPAPVEDEVPF